MTFQPQVARVSLFTLTLYLWLASSPVAAYDPPPSKRQCSTDADCATGLCNGYTCLLGSCLTSTDCAEDQLCNLNTNPCAAYSCPGKECPARCSKRQGTCEPIGDSCQADAECGPYKLCVVMRRFQCAEGDQRCSKHSRAECTGRHSECGFFQYCGEGEACGAGNRCVPKRYLKEAKAILIDLKKQALVESLPRDTSGLRHPPEPVEGAQEQQRAPSTPATLPTTPTKHVTEPKPK